MSEKYKDVECYVNLYKSIHGVKPKGLDLQDWSLKDLQAGIKVLSQLSRSHHERERHI